MQHIPIIWDYVAHKILELSSVSNEDFVNLVAHYTALINGEIDDEDELKQRGYSEEAISRMKKKKTSTSVKLLGLHFTKPLIKFKYNYLRYVLVLFDNYEKGNLPFPGSVAEQPSQVMDIFDIIQAIRQEAQNRVNAEAIQQVKKTKRQ